MKIKEFIEKVGVDRVRFIVPSRMVKTFAGLIRYTSSDQPTYPVTYRIHEEWNRMVKDNYKYRLKPDIEGFESHDFYVMDLEQMIRNGRVKMLVEAEIVDFNEYRV